MYRTERFPSRLIIITILAAWSLQAASVLGHPGDPKPGPSFARLLDDWMILRDEFREVSYESQRVAQARRSAAELQILTAEFKGKLRALGPKITSAALAQWSAAPGSSPKEAEWLVGWLHHYLAVKQYSEVLPVADALLAHREHLSQAQARDVIRCACMVCLINGELNVAKRYTRILQQLGPVEPEDANLVQAVEHSQRN